MSTARKFKNIELVNEVEETVVDKGSADKLANYFYRITNHEELFRMGKSFLEELKKGVKNFAFTSTGYKNSQQKTILGLCCYFDQNDNYKIAIISDHLSYGVFNDFVESSSVNSYQIGNGQDRARYHSFHHHFDFIDYSEFAKFYSNHLYTKTFDLELNKILDKYDIVFWDIPEMDKIKANPHFHYRISPFYESMTVIVSQDHSTGKQIENIKKFFNNYNIDLSGVLFDTTSVEQTKRKKILGIF
jgi:hypothetical protein